MTEDLPVFDPAPLDNLRRAVPNGSSLVRRVVDAWLRDAPSQISTARQAVASDDRETAHRAVHSLKSASAMVGAVRLAACCLTAEQAYKAGPLDPALLDAVERERASAVGAVLAVPEASPAL